MNEYISREAVLNLIEHNDKVCHYKDERYENVVYATTQTICIVVAEMPSADVQSVKHGYWIKQPEKFQIHEDVINSNYLYLCSCCNASDLHSERANNDGEVKFCWRCGAKMDGEQNG